MKQSLFDRIKELICTIVGHKPIDLWQCFDSIHADCKRCKKIVTYDKDNDRWI